MLTAIPTFLGSRLSLFCGTLQTRYGVTLTACFMQVGIDQLDQNKAVNKAGNIVGKFAAPKTKISDTALQPYDEVFGLQRFRETELIHGRSVDNLWNLSYRRCCLNSMQQSPWADTVSVVV